MISITVHADRWVDDIGKIAEIGTIFPPALIDPAYRDCKECDVEMPAGATVKILCMVPVAITVICMTDDRCVCASWTPDGLQAITAGERPEDAMFNESTSDVAVLRKWLGWFAGEEVAV